MYRKIDYLLLMSFISIAVVGCNLPSGSSLPSTEPPQEPLMDSIDPASNTTVDEDPASVGPPEPDAQPAPAEAGEVFITYVPSEGIGDIVVQVSLPQTPRYEDGAGVVVLISTYFTSTRGFQTDPNATELGLITISYLWPGVSDRSGVSSEGTFDYGGEISMRALRDVIRFASGDLPDRNGQTLSELSAVPVLADNVGLYAFSHPGIAAVNVLALHGDDLPGVGYFVGRENPTLDAISSVELGYWSEDRKPVENPLYQYPSSYSALGISIDYSSVRWDPDFVEPRTGDVGRAYLDLNSNNVLDETDFAFGAQIPRMYDKRFYSIELTRSLATNGALTSGTWPSDLATLEETETIWPFHASVERYPDLRSTTPDLKVMLVFARRDHVQPSRDKPHIHHAFDGFYGAAGLWTRLNPDLAYLEWISPEFADIYPENTANSEPGDWMQIHDWAYPDFRGAAGIVPLAAIAEMADRLHEGNWGEDLSTTLSDYPAPELD